MTRPHDSAYPSMVGDPGLTKRELIAAMAMQGYISAGSQGMPDKQMIADLAVQAADALIEKLSADPTPEVTK